MTKSDLILEYISKSKTDGKAFNLIVDFIADGFVKGKNMEIRGFGSFKPKVMETKNEHNPKTLEKAHSKKCAKITFSMSKELKGRINAKDD